MGLQTPLGEYPIPKSIFTILGGHEMGQVAESMKNFVRKERRIWDRGTTVQVLQKDKKHQIYALAVPK